MNYSCKKLYNFPVEIIQQIHNYIIDYNNRENHLEFLKNIKLSYLKYNFHKNYKILLKELYFINN